MKISVIVPAYNAEKWVAQCLKNLLRQTYGDLEIIVIDDGSTDRTSEIAAQYPVRLLRQPNSGLSITRNRGIDEATGDYVHFMDVDDLVNLDFYTRMVEAIEQAQADMAVCGMIDETRPYRSHTFAERWLLAAAEDKFNHTKVASWGYVWRYLFRRRFLVEGGLRFEPNRVIEDLPFSMEAVWQAGSIVTVPGATYYYKRRAGSILTNRNREFVRRRSADWSLVQRNARAFMVSHGLPMPGVEPLSVFSVLGIPLVTKKSSELGRRTSWHLLGLKIMERKHERLR